MDIFDILTDQKAEIDNFQPANFVARQEEKDVDPQSSRAQVVIGVRRSGKSTLCKKVLVESAVKFAYVNFDDERLAFIKADRLNDVLQTLFRIYGDFTHLLLDEIQNIPEWPLFVNRLLRQGLHLVITGSNANLLSGELITHLTGRHKQIALFPFSFAEYCSARGLDQEDTTTKGRGLRQNLMDGYLIRGGFPESLHDNGAEAEQYARALLHTVIQKDICRRYKLRYPVVVSRMANILLDQCCQPLSTRQLTADLGVKSSHTIDNYMAFMENAFLFFPVQQWSFKSVQRRIANKVYTVDNAFLSYHDNMLQGENLGWRLENAVAAELLRRVRRKANSDLYYLRKPKTFEVDFVVTANSRATELIQVTYDFSSPSRKLYRREVEGLLKGSAETGCDELTLITTQSDTPRIEADGKVIKVVKAPDWFLTNA